MTKLLEKVFVQASQLSELEQNALAKWMLHELASEKGWDNAFAESEGCLESLADEALREHQNKKTQPLDPDIL